MNVYEKEIHQYDFGDEETKFVLGKRLHLNWLCLFCFFVFFFFQGKDIDRFSVSALI